MLIKVNKIMNHDSLKFITCGMYAFTDELRAAWQSLCDAFVDDSTVDRYT